MPPSAFLPVQQDQDGAATVHPFAAQDLEAEHMRVVIRRLSFVLQVRVKRSLGAYAATPDRAR